MWSNPAVEMQATAVSKNSKELYNIIKQILGAQTSEDKRWQGSTQNYGQNHQWIVRTLFRTPE